MEKFLFTSESVTEGHPDKVCDAISDAVLDALMEKDPMSRVACEVATCTGFVLVTGEITTNAYVDIPKIARETIKEIVFRYRHGRGQGIGSEGKQNDGRGNRSHRRRGPGHDVRLCHQ